MAEGQPLLLTDLAANYLYGPGGRLVEQIQNSSVYYYHRDQLGSVRALSTLTGTLAATYNYDPYGNQTSAEPTLYNPFRYAGQYQDSESGLYYRRARYYDPATQQFLTPDPLLKAAGMQRPYAYTEGSPLNATDPSGLICTQGGSLPASECEHQGSEWIETGLSNPWPLRPGERPVLPVGGRYVAIDTSKLPPGSLIPDNTPPGQ